MNGREITLEEAARDVIKHVFRKFRKRRSQDPIEVWVRGNHLDYFFEARVCCRKVKRQVERAFEEMNRKLSIL